MALKESKKEDKYNSPWGDVPGEEKIKPRAMGTVSFDDLPGKIDMRKVIFGIGILVIVLGTLAFWLFSRVGKPSVGLEFERPGEVALGEAFIVYVNFSNFSDDILKNVRLVLNLSDGVSFVGQNSNQRAVEQLVGDLGPGSLGKEEFKLVVTGGEQSLKKLEAKLIYSVAPNDKVTFENSAETNIRVGKPAVSLEVEAPESVFSGENFEIKVKYKNNTQNDFENFALTMKYPEIFEFESVSEEPTKGNNYWEIGTLEPNSEAEFVVKGSVVGPEGSVANFDAELTTEVQGEKYSVNRQVANVKVSVAPLSLSFKINNSDEYVAELAENLKYTITYKNNSDFALQNVKISVKLIGEMFDFSTARSDASFNSFTNTFTWTTAEESKLANVAPGAQSTLNLDIKIKNSFPISRLSDKNFILKAEGQIESPTVPPGVDASKTVSVGGLETKVAGHIEVDSQAFYRDAATGILNSGPYPPKVNQPTEYTIHWKLKNYATDVSGIIVSAFLQSGAQFTGKTKSTIGDLPVYDQGSGKVIWNISNLSATRGVVGSPVEAVFQVVLTPNSNQVGDHINILSETDIQAKDDFTSVTLMSDDAELTTELVDDPTVTGETKVQL